MSFHIGLLFGASLISFVAILLEKTKNSVIEFTSSTVISGATSSTIGGSRNIAIWWIVYLFVCRVVDFIPCIAQGRWILFFSFACDIILHTHIVRLVLGIEILFRSSYFPCVVGVIRTKE